MSHYTQPLLRDRNDLARNISVRMRDPDYSRWRKHEIYRAIGTVLDGWSQKVFVPCLYSLDLVPGRTVYDIPSYVTTPFQLEQYNHRDHTWGTIQAGVRYNPDLKTGSTQSVEIPHQTYDGGYGLDVRIVYWSSPSGMPDIPVRLTKDLSASGTSITLSDSPYVGRSGYVRVDGEFIAYGGIKRSRDGTLTLSNCVRGIHETVKSKHDTTAEVVWCVAIPNEELWEHLFNGVAYELHRIQLTDAAHRERGIHEKMVKFYDDKCKEFWRSWVGNRPTIVTPFEIETVDYYV